MNIELAQFLKNNSLEELIEGFKSYKRYRCSKHNQEYLAPDDTNRCFECRKGVYWEDRHMLKPLERVEE